MPSPPSTCFAFWCHYSASIIPNFVVFFISILFSFHLYHSPSLFLSFRFSFQYDIIVLDQKNRSWPNILIYCVCMGQVPSTIPSYIYFDFTLQSIFGFSSLFTLCQRRMSTNNYIVQYTLPTYSNLPLNITLNGLYRPRWI